MAQFTFTPLHWACLGGHTVVVELLIDKGADAEAKDNVSRDAEDGKAEGVLEVFQDRDTGTCGSILRSRASLQPLLTVRS